jgi:hypothetical protein
MYELQRSADGRVFDTIAIVFSKNGRDNSYTYPDINPLTGINYYRLKIVDNGNKTEYSRVISFRFGEKFSELMIVAPNPARESVRVKLTGFTPGFYYMKLFNTSGQQVAVKKINMNQHDQIEIIKRELNMIAGKYWLCLYDNTGKRLRTTHTVIGD